MQHLSTNPLASSKKQTPYSVYFTWTSVIRIHIHVRIRIYYFFKKFFIFFKLYRNLTFLQSRIGVQYFFLGLREGFPSFRRSPSLQRWNSWTFLGEWPALLTMFLFLSFFCGSFFGFWGFRISDPYPQRRTNWIRIQSGSGSGTLHVHPVPVLVLILLPFRTLYHIIHLYYFINRVCGNTGTSCICRDENPMPRIFCH